MLNLPPVRPGHPELRLLRPPPPQHRELGPRRPVYPELHLLRSVRPVLPGNPCSNSMRLKSN